MVHPGGRRVFILRVPPGALSPVRDTPPSTRAVTTRVIDLDPEVAEVRLELLEPQASVVFTPFIEDVADWVARAHDDDAAVSALVERFAYWRVLLSGALTEGLAAEAAQGLWGELWVMRNLLRRSWGQDCAAAWTGQIGRAHV